MLAEHCGHGIEEYAVIVAENQASHAAPFRDLHPEPGILRRAPSFFPSTPALSLRRQSASREPREGEIAGNRTIHSPSVRIPAPKCRTRARPAEEIMRCVRLVCLS